MINLAYFLLILLAASQSNNVDCREIQRHEYLNLPNEQQLSNDFNPETTLEAIHRLKVDPMMSYSRITDIIKTHYGASGIPKEHKKLYKSLLDISNCRRDCSSEIVREYLSIWTVVQTNFNTRFHEYIKDLGAKTFFKCASTESDRIKRGEVQLPDMDDMGDVFRQTFQPGPLFQRLQNFDMAHDKFNVKFMVKAIKELQGDNSMETDEFLVIEKFMDHECARFDDESHRILTIISIDMLYRNTSEYKNLLIMNEFHRLCIDWNRPTTKATIETSIRKQLTKTSFKRYIKGLMQKSSTGN